MKSYQTQLKINLRALSREDRYENIQIINNRKEYKREKKFEAITERMKRVEEMQNEKRFMVEEKMKIQDSIRIKKNKMMAKFTKLLHKDKLFSKEEFHKKLFGNIDHILLSSKNGSKETLNVNSEDDDKGNENLKDDNAMKDLTQEPKGDEEVKDKVKDKDKDKENEKLQDIVVEGQEDKRQNTDFIPVPIDNKKRDGGADGCDKEEHKEKEKEMEEENKDNKNEEDKKENNKEENKIGEVDQIMENDIKEANDNNIQENKVPKDITNQIEKDNEIELENAIPNAVVSPEESNDKESGK